MKTKTRIVLSDNFHVNILDVLKTSKNGEQMVVTHLKANESGTIVTFRRLSRFRMIRFCQIKYLQLKKYLYDKYIKPSEQKNSNKQPSGDRSACNNSL